jgi:hypothetical protein
LGLKRGCAGSATATDARGTVTVDKEKLDCLLFEVNTLLEIEYLRGRREYDGSSSSTCSSS